MQNKLYHMGIRGNIARSKLAYANETRDWRIYQDFAHVLIHHARELYSKDAFGVSLEETVYALDSTTIDLCLALFPWAKFRTHKGAVKMHTLLDLRGNIPSFIAITDGKVHDVNMLDVLIIEPGSFYIMDRGYIDFERLYHMHRAQGFFVVRGKSNLSFRRQYSNPVDKASGLRCDQIITLSSPASVGKYPEQLRRIKYSDPQTGKSYVFLTNNFELAPKVIADLYKSGVRGARPSSLVLLIYDTPYSWTVVISSVCIVVVTSILISSRMYFLQYFTCLVSGVSGW